MNRKVTRDEVIILMFFKLTWDSPRRFRPAVQQKIILWGWDPSPVLLGARTAPGRPGGPLDGSKDLAVTAGAGIVPWLSLALSQPGDHSQWSLLTIISAHAEWWCGTKCPPITLSTNQSSLFGLKIIPELPGHVEMMVSTSLLPFYFFILEIPVLFFLIPGRNSTSFVQLSDPISRSVMKDRSHFVIKVPRAAPEKSNLGEIRIRSQSSHKKCKQNLQYSIKGETQLPLSPGKSHITPWKLCLSNSQTSAQWSANYPVPLLKSCRKMKSESWQCQWDYL